MNIHMIAKKIKNKIKGNFSIAKEDGMVVEENVSVMGGVNFGSEPYLITLRKGCRISTEVLFVNHDGGTWAFRNTWDEYRDIVKYGRIEIGEYSFVGARSIIMPGVKVGNNCVIGAGSIVTKDVPDGTVVVGVPAKKVCNIKEYAEQCKIGIATDFDKVAYDLDKKKYLMEWLK